MDTGQLNAVDPGCIFCRAHTPCWATERCAETRELIVYLTLERARFSSFFRDAYKHGYTLWASHCHLCYCPYYGDSAAIYIHSDDGALRETTQFVPAGEATVSKRGHLGVLAEDLSDKFDTVQDRFLLDALCFAIPPGKLCGSFGLNGVLGVLGQIADYRDQLYDIERTYISGAVQKRQIEYAAGRQYARQALTLLGRSSGPIGTGYYRNPEWPDGVIGSISHSDRLAVAVVAELGCAHRGIGVDIEADGRVTSDLDAMVLTRWEQKRLALRADAGVSTTLIFSAKESVFKAVYPLVGLMTSFDEVEIDFVPGTATYSARYVGASSDNAVLAKGRGLHTKVDNHVVCFYFIE